jgi:hypothetical protein
MKKAVIGIDGGLSGAMVSVDEDMALLDYRDIPIVESVKSTKKRKGPKAGQTVTSKRNLFDVPGILNQLEDMLVGIRRNDMIPFVALEKAQPRLKDGSKQGFLTGRGFGLLEMAVVASGAQYWIVAPQTWMKVMLVDAVGDDTKAKSLQVASRLFPSLELKKPKGRVLSMDGRSDAALIACYALRGLVGGES